MKKETDTSLYESISQRNIFITTSFAYGFYFALFMYLFDLISGREIIFIADLVGGIFFGLIMGWIMSSRLKGIIVKISFTNKKDITNKIIIKLTQLGYSLSLKEDELLIFKPTAPLGKLMYGNTLDITVTLKSKEGIVVGPSCNVNKLKEIN